jgi:hypothetical protein
MTENDLKQLQQYGAQFAGVVNNGVAVIITKEISPWYERSGTVVNYRPAQKLYCVEFTGAERSWFYRRDFEVAEAREPGYGEPIYVEPVATDDDSLTDERVHITAFWDGDIDDIPTDDTPTEPLPAADDLVWRQARIIKAHEQRIAELEAERSWFRNGLHNITMLTDSNSLRTAQNIARERLYAAPKGKRS